MNNFAAFQTLTNRNIKLYFKDKTTFFMSLITPLILLVLFVTFLRNVYISSLESALPEGIVIGEEIINGFLGGWFMSSILGVSCVTVAFCSNITMVQDRISGTVSDILVTPVHKNTLSLSYFVANYITTLIICLVAMCIGFIYLASVGWFLSWSDILLILGDILLCTLFGTSLAAVAEYFINSQGGISAAATLVSSMYGFVCGAYMPISQFAMGIRNFISFVPGTYGVVLLRNHYMQGAFESISQLLPADAVTLLKDMFDNHIYFLGHQVQNWTMYVILGGCAILLITVYILLNISKSKTAKSTSPAQQK